jgi:hypothetical protein
MRESRTSERREAERVKTQIDSTVDMKWNDEWHDIPDNGKVLLLRQR